jgi:hypothetical protein
MTSLTYYQPLYGKCLVGHASHNEEMGIHIDTHSHTYSIMYVLRENLCVRVVANGFVVIIMIPQPKAKEKRDSSS